MRTHACPLVLVLFAAAGDEDPWSDVERSLADGLEPLAEIVGWIDVDLATRLDAAAAEARAR